MTNANCVPDAFMSKAEIYKQRGETALATFSYTQAIKVKPDDAEIYFKRAKMYEKMGEVLLAMEDYAKVSPIKQYKYCRFEFTDGNTSAYKVMLIDDNYCHNCDNLPRLHLP